MTKTKLAEGTKSTDGSKSGTDQGAAESDAAFDPSKTRPEEKEAAGNEKEGNPLAVSGANQKKSVLVGDNGGPEMKGTTKNEGGGKASGGGSSQKEGKPPAAQKMLSNGGESEDH